MFGFDSAPWERDFRQELKLKLPDVKPLSFKTGALLFGGVAITGMMIGATIGTYVFFGVVTLAGLIAVSESNPYVKYVVMNSNKQIDLIILAGTVYATAMLGVTVAASLTIAGLGYTLVYAPWVRNNINIKTDQDEK
jgi:hypothetical protein